MRNLYRFFVNTTNLRVGDLRVLDADASHHLARVLRVPVNSDVHLFDGANREFHARIVSIDKGERGDRVEVVCLSELSDANRESPLAITLGAAVGKSDKLDLIIQKATEMGVAAIQPLITDRTENRLGNIVSDDISFFGSDHAGGNDTAAAEMMLKKLAHWHQIAISACQQSGRNTLPMILPPLSFKRWIAYNTVHPSPSSSTFFSASVSESLCAPPCPSLPALRALRAIGYPGLMLDDVTHQAKFREQNEITGKSLTNSLFPQDALQQLQQQSSSVSSSLKPKSGNGKKALKSAVSASSAGASKSHGVEQTLKSLISSPNLCRQVPILHALRPTKQTLNVVFDTATDSTDGSNQNPSKSSFPLDRMAFSSIRDFIRHHHHSFYQSCPSSKSSTPTSSDIAFRPASELPVIQLLVGPEGGFTPAEIDLARTARFASVSLGPRILRYETAALAAVAAFQSHLGDL